MKKIYSLLLVLIIGTSHHVMAQTSGFQFNCTRDSVITGCSTVCFTLNATVPDIHGSTNTSVYSIQKIAGSGVTGGCFSPYADPAAPGPSTTLPIADDQYTGVITIPFTFPFFGQNYTQLLISHNGYVTFDLTRLGLGSHWTCSPGNLPNTSYDRSVIMGVYQDFDLRTPNNSPTLQTKMEVIGTAPHRKWVLTYYKLPLFGTSCTNFWNNTNQLVLHEGSGVIEVFVFDKQICTGWNSGKSMIGIQDFTRTKGYVPPGRGAADVPWGSVGMNEAWRFVPSDGPTLFRGADLILTNGTVVAVANTVSNPNNTISLSFPNVCVSASTTYLIRSKYEDYNNPGTFFYGIDTFRVNKPNSVTTTTTVTNVTCNGGNNGAINMAAIGAGTYTYSINGGTPQSTGVFSNLAANTYSINVTQVGSGCTKDTTIIITQPPAIAATLTTTPSTCTATGSISVAASGGTGTLQYSMDAGPFQSSATFTAANGPHTITVKDANGCTKDFSVTVPLNEEITFTAPAPVTICNGQSTPLVVTSNATAFLWSPATGLSSATVQSPTASPSTSTTYTITATLGSCTRTGSVLVTVFDAVQVNAGIDSVTIFQGDNYQMNATVTGTTNFTWSPITGLSNATILNPIAQPATSTLYILSAQNALGCSARDSIYIEVVPICIKVRNAFSPNGDGRNDVWKVYDDYGCLKNVTVRVFNRNGSKVYESRNYRNEWNGTYNGKPIPDGTYYAVIEFTLVDGRKKVVNSDVTVVR